MKSPGDGGFRAIIALSSVIGAAGAALFLFSRTLPVFLVPHAQASEARYRWCSAAGELIDREAGSAFFALFGSRYWLGDISVGLCLFGLTLAALAATLRACTNLPDMPWLRTPGSRSTFALVAFAAVAFIGLVGVESSMRDLDRGYACGDALRRTAGFLPVLFGLIGAALAVVIGLVSLAFGRLPVALSRWDGDRPARSWVVTLLTVPPLVGLSVLTSVSIPTSNASATPAIVLLAYLILAIRAAILAPAQGPPSHADGREIRRHPTPPA